MGLIAQPAGKPAICGGDGKREAAKPPDTMQGGALGNLANQRQKMIGRDVGMGNEMAPEHREGAAATRMIAAIGTKKRMRLISRRWPWGR